MFYICRQHFACVEDCLDAFILAAAMNVMGITELDEQRKGVQTVSVFRDSEP